MTTRPAPTIAALFSACALLLAPHAIAQDVTPYTLHVYTNLIQVPTLVLSPNMEILPPIDKDKFVITLDGGPKFHPSQAHLEGDDPIALAVLFDTRIDSSWLKAFAGAFSQLSPQLLHPRDRVAFFAIDCQFVHSSYDVPANPHFLASTIASVLTAPGLHGDKSKPACGQTLRLWDSVIQVTKSLADLPGRRVILLVSSGQDRNNSTQKFDDASRYATTSGVAIFGLRDIFDNRDRDNLLNVVCQANGGMVSTVPASDLKKTLQYTIAALRARYILEFRRPDNFVNGFHEIAVTSPITNAYIRTTGASAPIADPTLLSAPNTIHTAPSPVKLGTHHEANPL